MNAPTHARSGPDWSSFCSDWMTQWERFNDDTYRDKIQIGIDDLKALPLRLTSGPDFEYDPKGQPSSLHRRAHKRRKSSAGVHGCYSGMD